MEKQKYNIKRPLRGFIVGLLAVLSACAAACGQQSPWVYRGADGRLVYRTTPRGDRIMDFSYAGYMGGGVAIPDVAVKATVGPSGSGDDTSAIQAAIAKVSALPLVGKFRGAVLLEPGTFYCDQPLNIAADGVVLRGSGDQAGKGGSTIFLTGKPHIGITVRRLRGGRGRRRNVTRADVFNSPEAMESPITDAYVPSGSMSFHVADASRFAVGDYVAICKPVTQAWVDFMQMNDLVRGGKHQTWLKVPGYLITQRRISAIVGNTITLDVPLSDSLDERYLDPPGPKLVRTPPTTQPSQIGIEDLRIQSPPQRINHSKPHFSAIAMDGQDCWMRDLFIQDTMNSVGVNGQRITLQRVAILRTVPHIGASKPAEFSPNGTQILMDRCSVRADNVWFAATGAGFAGPIVLLNCDFYGDSAAESHQRWSTGILYDNCVVPDGGITIRDRGSMGSGHGWTMGWGVIWNCRARDYIVQNPPGALNWLIGSIGQADRAAQPFAARPLLPQGTIESPGKPVKPQSLYLTQLAQRLGPQAVRNLGYSWP